MQAIVLPMMPHDINVEQNFFDAFDDEGCEWTANWIVRLLQRKGKGWVPFTLKELRDFFNAEREDGNDDVFSIDAEFFREKWLLRRPGRMIEVSGDFVIRCHKASPVKRSKRRQPR